MSVWNVLVLKEVINIDIEADDLWICLYNGHLDTETHVNFGNVAAYVCGTNH